MVEVKRLISGRVEGEEILQLMKEVDLVKSLTPEHRQV